MNCEKTEDIKVSSDEINQGIMEEIDREMHNDRERYNDMLRERLILPVSVIRS